MYVKAPLDTYFYFISISAYFKITVGKRDSQEKFYASIIVKWLLITLTEYTVMPQHRVLTLLVVNVNRIS